MFNNDLFVLRWAPVSPNPNPNPNPVSPNPSPNSVSCLCDVLQPMIV